MSEHWFKPRRYGYGATPTSWEGWLVIAGYIALIVWQAHLWMQPPDLRVGLYVGVVLIETLALIAIARIKTDGEWKWRWGGD